MNSNSLILHRIMHIVAVLAWTGSMLLACGGTVESTTHLDDTDELESYRLAWTDGTSNQGTQSTEADWNTILGVDKWKKAVETKCQYGSCQGAGCSSDSKWTCDGKCYQPANGSCGSTTKSGMIAPNDCPGGSSNFCGSQSGCDASLTKYCYNGCWFATGVEVPIPDSDKVAIGHCLSNGSKSVTTKDKNIGGCSDGYSCNWTGYDSNREYYYTCDNGCLVPIGANPPPPTGTKATCTYGTCSYTGCSSDPNFVCDGKCFQPANGQCGSKTTCTYGTCSYTGCSSDPNFVCDGKCFQPANGACSQPSGGNSGGSSSCENPCSGAGPSSDPNWYCDGSCYVYVGP